jgi:hypothetical protein
MGAARAVKRRAMNLQRSSIVSLILTLLVGGLGLVFAPSARQQEVIKGLDEEFKTSSTARGGVKTVTFDSPQARVIVNLPDDMMAGDTISGTVVAEPRGNREEERSEHLEELRGCVVEIRGEEQPKSPSVQDPAKLKAPRATTYGPVQTVIFLTPEDAIGDKRVQDPSERVSYVFSSGNGYAGTFTLGPFAEYPPVLRVSLKKPPPAAKPPAQGQRQTGAESSSWPVIASAIVPVLEMHVTTPLNNLQFDFPDIGQQGRHVEIIGPFDGNSENTSLNWTAIRTKVPDFEKNTEGVSGGFGLIDGKPIAESPRKAVFTAPTNVTGPIELHFKEGNTETTQMFRNVGVKLSAPKTSLLRGERTTLTIQVNGLQGIDKPVPLTLESSGVITMEGGMFQPLMIQPSDVGVDGRYTTTRGITGVQTGAWGATATVVTHRFDICLQDDSNPQTAMLWNSFTGDYNFTPSGGTSLNGQGTVTRKDCTITLMDSTRDRRVQGNIDPCTKTGSASVQVVSSKVKFTITDRNTADNTCTCGPGCK